MSLRRSTRVASRSVTTSAPVQEPVLNRKRTSDIETARKGKKPKKALVQELEDTAFKKPEVPVTPVRKKRLGPKNPPPLTPTPSLVNIIRAPYSSGDIDDATPPPIDRPVEPHISSATLVTPGGTQKTAYVPADSDINHVQNGLPIPTATTGNLLEKACAHLVKTDPRMRSVIEKHRCAIFSPEGLAEEIDPFRSLSSGIMGQQVSGAAAKAIKNKFIALFNENTTEKPNFPTPKQVAAADITRLRLAGLSQRKAEYIQGLAQKFVDGELSNEMLMKASDEQVMEKLIAVRGLGDLGVQRGMAHYFGKDVSKLKNKGGKWKYMSEQEMLDKSAPFAPYRSLFMWYMWRVEDVDISVMQN